ncbi:MAG: sensor histidine kinase [Steroidobacteraceae bacterium]|jgi:signal transduction histidine kinase
MLRLYLRFYLALLASLAVFGCATAVIWHFAGGPMEQAGLSLSRLVQNVLPAAQAPPADQQEALRRLAAGLNGDVTLLAKDGTVIAAVGLPLSAPSPRHHRTVIFPHWQGDPVTAIYLADGRLLIASVPIGFGNIRQVFHMMLVLLVVAIGVAAYPIVRRLTRGLERLQRGVESLGAGDLTSRVVVEGRDEVARLAASFNRAASQIEQLVGAHRTLLANTSHELRTPLTRIRLAVDLLKASADPKIKAGLEQDIAELDGLVDEILLASRLDAVTALEVTDDIDLLALAAEECARYDDVHLEGAAVKISGDPRLLRRLLRNLLENAKRYGVPPTQVRVATDGNAAVLTVWDGGPGPAPAEYEQIFTPFYRRLDGRNNAGTGLGLSLVRQIARRHGGDARCATLSDQRAAFVITLPGKSGSHVASN